MKPTKRVRAPQCRRVIVRSTLKVGLTAKLSVAPPISVRGRMMTHTLMVPPSNLRLRIPKSATAKAFRGLMCEFQTRRPVYWAELTVFPLVHPNHTVLHIHRSQENPSRYPQRTTLWVVS